MSTELQQSNSLAELQQTNLSALKAQEVSLSLLLLKIAQREANRITKLSTVIDKLEDSIFDVSIIDHLSPAEQIQRYQLALQSTQQSSSYIRDAINGVNWSDIETKIMILTQESEDETILHSADSSDLQAAALKLLSQLSSNK